MSSNDSVYLHIAMKAFENVYENDFLVIFGLRIVCRKKWREEYKKLINSVAWSNLDSMQFSRQIRRMIALGVITAPMRDGYARAE